MSQDKIPTVLMIMLCMHCGAGGAEKRYARVFEMLVAKRGPRHRLVISRAVLDSLQGVGILQNHDPYLIVLSPPFRSYFKGSIGEKGEKTGLSGVLYQILTLLDALWYVWQCWRVIGRVQPDVVHPLITAMYLAVPALLLKPALPTVMSSYSPTFEPEQERGMLGRKLAVIIKRFAMGRATAIDALSKFYGDLLIPYKIDANKINAAPCSFTDFSLCQPIPHKKRYVVFLARFVHMKDPLLLARAIPKVVAQEPDIHFYFLGSGPLQPQIEATLQEGNVTDYVTLRFEPNPTQVLNQSAIFVSLQLDNNYPCQSLLEAMACGNAVVATDVGEEWRLVDEGTGLRVPQTADAVAEAIVRLLRDPKLPQYQKTARQRVLSEQTPERFFQYITDVYQRVVQTA